MEGIKIIRDESNGDRYVQIDMKLIEQNEMLQDLIDDLIIDLTKNDETFTIEEVEADLKKMGKL